MKIIFHGYSFIHYAPLYLLIGDKELPDIEFRNPTQDDNIDFINGNYTCSNDEIHILLLGQDRLYVSPFDEEYISITKLIWQRPLAILQSKKNQTGVWVDYQSGSSFHHLLNKMFTAAKGNFRLSTDFKIDVFNDEEFQLLENGFAEYAVTWNPWKKDAYPNVDVHDIPFPIMPYGWTCLIVKKEELKNQEKLEIIKLLVKKTFLKVFDIYKYFENSVYTLRDYKSKLQSVIDVVTNQVDSKDHPHVRPALELLSKNKIWITNEIYRDKDLTDLSDYLLKETEKEATKSAVAEIVNRNYSHHIGSHVSHRATFDKIVERLGLTISKVADDRNIFHTVIQMENKLNRYKDERNEFISAIAAGVGIQAAKLYGDVLLPFIENSLLMDNIAANENINYETGLKQNRLKIECVYPKGEIYANYLLDDSSPITSKELPYFKIVSDFNSNFYTQKKYSIDDIEIGVPGALGKHALYSILENYIRNTAKHSPKEKLKGSAVVIQLIIEDKDDDYYKVKLTDNVSCIEDDALESLEKGIKLEIRKKEKLGIQDMKINACLLAGKEITEENCVESLHVYRDEKTKLLSYEFDIIKAKKIAIIHSTFSKENLKKNGIFSFKSLTGFSKIQSNQSFQFAVIDESILTAENKLEEFFCYLPSRILIYNSDNNSTQNFKNCKTVKFSDKTLFDIDDADELLERCWKIWLTRWSKEKEVFGLNLYLDQSQYDLPTQTWINSEAKLNNRLSGIGKYSTWYKQGLNEILTKEFKEANNQILFDRHGCLLGDEKLGVINFLNKNTYNLIDKNSKDFDKIFTADLKDGNSMLPFELFESGLLRILLIDERAQERSATELNSQWQLKTLGFDKGGDFNLFDALWASKIFTVTHLQIADETEKSLKSEIDETQNHFLKMRFEKNNDGNFNLQFDVNFTQLPDAFTGYTEIGEGKYTLSLQQLGVDAVIIHRTILKDLIAKLGSSFLQKIEEVIPFIFITTGGGVVHDVNKKIKVIPFGALQDFILSNNRIAKYSLTQTLMNLTANKF